MLDGERSRAHNVTGFTTLDNAANLELVGQRPTHSEAYFLDQSLVPGIVAVADEHLVDLQEYHGPRSLFECLLKQRKS